MRVSFVKMHGLGNDFVVLDARAQALPPITAQFAAALANRHTGIGCDQLIELEPSAVATFKMRIFNADGSEVAACGNATRAVGLLHGAAATIETAVGLLSATPGDCGITVDMGTPHFDWNTIPLAYAMDTLSMPVGWPIDDNTAMDNPVAVNVGNPHAIFFVPDCNAVPLDRLGPTIENDPLFPERVNVNVATVLSRESIALRVWERGAGLTMACGTGACATAVAAMRRGLTERRVTVTLPGGGLLIEWTPQGTILMTGPAAISFTGSFESSDYGAPA